jgi:uncharacterized protein (DUF1810 family)
MADPFNLERFVAAQRGVDPAALEELRRGRKESHWMWFVFPQLAALGRSETAQYYGLSGRAEAAAYLAHPILGARLVDGVAAVLPHAARGPETVFGVVDAMKFRSSTTLFEGVGGGAAFAAALDGFYGGARDEATLRLLAGGDPAG